MALLRSQRKKIRDYPCSYDPEKYTDTDGALDEAGLVFPQAYKTAEGMIAIAKEIAAFNGVDILSLPFCYTVEMEAYGGDVNYGDENVGPRPGDYVLYDPRDFVKLPEPDLDSGRIAEVIKAISILKDQGYTVATGATGAVSIMSGMMDLVPVLKALRKEEDYMIEALVMFRDFEAKYFKRLVEAGADIISLTELSMPNILGPEIVETIMKYYVHPLLTEVKDYGDYTIHMCPKTTYGLVDTGYAEFQDIELDQEYRYGEALLAATDEDNRIFGRRCIATLKTSVTKRGLKSVKLKEV